MKLIWDSNKRWACVHVQIYIYFWLFICLFAKQTVHASVCVCKHLIKKLNSLLNHYDKIMFSCLNANSCGYAVSLCLQVLWFCLSVSLSLCLSHTIISLSRSCVLFSFFFFFLPQSSFASTSELLKIVAAFMASEDCLIFSQERRKTITLRKDEWTAITCGEFMVIFLHDKYLTSTNKVSLLTSHMLQMMPRQYAA